jgi:hypothetical protein
MRDAPWPSYANAIENSTFQGYSGEWPTDNSYLGNHQIGDMFLRIPDTVYSPYIAHTQDDGYVLVHGHPLNGKVYDLIVIIKLSFMFGEQLMYNVPSLFFNSIFFSFLPKGTKFFTWGQSGPGRFMQDFLAGGGKRQGDYTELQVGPAPTQMQTFPLPKQSVLEWTEWFKGFDGDIATLRGSDYQAALDAIETWMKSDEGMPKSSTNDWDEFFSAHATDAPSQILVSGQPWGALEEKRLNKKLAPGLTFTLPTAGSDLYDVIIY